MVSFFDVTNRLVMWLATLHISKSETFRFIVFEVKADSEIEIKPIDLSVTLIR